MATSCYYISFINPKNYWAYLDSEAVELLMPKRFIKPRTFQLNPDQTIFIGGLVRIDFSGNSKINTSFFVANQLYLHRTKTVKADEIYDAIGCELSYIEELVALDAVIIESGITEIGAAGIAMYDNITSLSIPNTVTAIRGRIGGSGITEITIPESVVVMEGAFKNYDGILGIPFVSKEEADSVWGSNWLDSESNPTFVFNK